MTVVDASVVVAGLLDDGPTGRAVRARLRGERLAAPSLIDLEVLSVLRRLHGSQRVPARRASQAVTDLADLPIERAPHRSLLRRCWQLRGNLTPYDAAYVALAEALDEVLLTADGRLARAPGLRCATELVAVDRS